MDVNGSRFHMLLGDRDWLPLLIEQQADRLWWDRSRQQLSLAPEILEVPQSADDHSLGPDDRRGAAYDHYGNVYWIDRGENRIRFRPAATPERVADFWTVRHLHDAREEEAPAGDFEACDAAAPLPTPRLRGLAVTTHEYMVVGTLQPAGLLIFDLHAGGRPDWIHWPQSIDFAPFDFSPAADGGLWILDRGPGLVHRFWRLDRFFRVLSCKASSRELLPADSGLFQSVDGDNRSHAALHFPEGVSLSLASPLVEVNPYAIEALPDGSVLILAAAELAPASVIYHFIDGELNDSIILDRDVIGALLADGRIRAQDFSFVQEPGLVAGLLQGSLYLVAENGKQAFKFSLQLQGSDIQLGLQSAFLPLRNYSGKGLVNSPTDIYYDYDEIWLPLAEQPRRRYKTLTDEGGLPALAGILLDGKEPELRWHRLILDACIPDGCAVYIDSRAANQRESLADLPWSREPGLYLRANGSELPYHEPFPSLTELEPGMGSWELLFQNAVGRYLELRLTLQGTGRLSPKIQTLRAYYPRFSYLDEYLPSVYREDDRSASFLDRFLANLEGLYTVLEGHVELAEVLFDSRTAPPDYLEWLAGWLGAMLDPAWNDGRRRLFLDHAELMFRWRGTQIGMRAAIRLSIDPCPDESIFDELLDQRGYRLGTMGGRAVRIAESFLARNNQGAVLGDPTGPVTLERSRAEETWRPQQGAASLHRLFRKFLRRLYPADSDSALLGAINSAWGLGYASFNAIAFPPLLPEEEVFARDWTVFTREVIGFTYSPAGPADKTAYQEFLARRYQQIERLNQAYRLAGSWTYSGFNQIDLPSVFPDGGNALFDWVDFVSLALPIKRNANRFSVLVPTELNESFHQRLRRMAQVEEIVAREKPAHTDFEVKLYWALFQVGSARLGMDTSLGEGSRYVALVLGSNYLGQSYLSESHPWGIDDRRVIGRDQIFYNRSLRE